MLTMPKQLGKLYIEIEENHDERLPERFCP